mmetsp:Transcript_57618/g.153966  ORF Transcript_57618/g.153966 Transcript_57618/m.153966 type:complete len:282 (-) Transcript_57618:485-1330(-)
MSPNTWLAHRHLHCSAPVPPLSWPRRRVPDAELRGLLQGIPVLERRLHLHGHCGDDVLQLLLPRQGQDARMHGLIGPWGLSCVGRGRGLPGQHHSPMDSDHASARDEEVRQGGIPRPQQSKGTAGGPQCIGQHCRSATRRTDCGGLDLAAQARLVGRQVLRVLYRRPGGWLAPLLRLCEKQPICYQRLLVPRSVLLADVSVDDVRDPCNATIAHALLPHWLQPLGRLREICHQRGARATEAQAKGEQHPRRRQRRGGWLLRGRGRLRCDRRRLCCGAGRGR